MKKYMIMIITTIMCMSFIGCDKSKESSNTSLKVNNNTINITEDMYVTWVTEIYTNTDDYIGKKVKIEGMYMDFYIEEEDATYNLVYRNGPGCCEDDRGYIGFEFEYSKELPKKDDWIEVEGILSYYEAKGEQHVTLKNATVNVKTDRGSETVNK